MFSDAYADSRAPLSSSDHSMIYQQKLKAAKLQIRIVKRWDQDSIQQFQGCFHCTDGASFVGACVDLHEYTDVVTSYVHCCEESQPKSNQIMGK